MNCKYKQNYLTTGMQLYNFTLFHTTSNVKIPPTYFKTPLPTPNHPIDSILFNMTTKQHPFLWVMQIQSLSDECLHLKKRSNNLPTPQLSPFFSVSATLPVSRGTTQRNDRRQSHSFVMGAGDSCPHSIVSLLSRSLVRGINSRKTN